MSETINHERNDKLLRLVLLFFNRSLAFSPDDVPQMSWSTQKQFLNMTVGSTRLQKYPANKKFSQLFFKKVIDNLNSPQGVHDDFYTFLCSVMSNESVGDKFSFRHYVINNDLSNVITLKETNNMVVNGTTGLKTWEKELFLCGDRALCNKEIFKNKTVLELGSGVGLAGITISKLCDVQSMFLTDHHYEVLDTIQENIRINFPHSAEKGDSKVKTFKNNNKEIGILLLDWNYIQGFSYDIVPDVIIGADIVYDPSILQPLCNVFQTFFKINRNLELYIQSVIRNEETFENFLQLLDISNFKRQTIFQETSVNIEWNHDVKRCLLKITCDC